MDSKVFLQGYDGEEVMNILAKKVAEALLPMLQPKEEEKLLTSQEVCKMLQITPQTLCNYMKKGKLQPLKTAGKNYFQKEAVLASLVSLKKYNRDAA